jgi:hypothetical protein
MRLQIALVDHRDLVRVLQHQIGLGEALGHVAALDGRGLRDVDRLGVRGLGGLGHGDGGVRERLAGVGLGPELGHAGRAGLHRLQRVDGGRQDLVLHLDQVERFLGDGGLVGRHGRHRLAGEHDAVDGQHRVSARGRLVLELGDVARGQHRAHAGQRLGLAGVDRDDLGVRVRAAQELGVQQTARRDVGHVLHAAGDLLGPVGAGDGQAHATHVARRLHRAHRLAPCGTACAASLIAVTIFV